MFDSGVGVPLGSGLGASSSFSKYGKRDLCSSLSVFLPAFKGKIPVTDQPPASGDAARFSTGANPSFTSTPFTRMFAVPPPVSSSSMSN